MVRTYARRIPPEVRDTRYPVWGVTPTERRFPFYVSVVLHDKAYGGAEEGGWYYDTYDPIEVRRVSNQGELEFAVNDLQTDEDYDNEGRPPITSVTSRGIYEIHITERAPQQEPRFRPRYYG